MVYTYDVAPRQLRYQIGVALKEGIGEYRIVDRFGLGDDSPDDGWLRMLARNRPSVSQGD